MNTELNRTYDFNGQVHTMSKEEFDAIERSGRCSRWGYGIDIPAVVSGVIGEMDKRPSPTQPGAFPIEAVIHTRRAARPITKIDEFFIRTNRSTCTITTLSSVLGLSVEVIRDYCRSEGLIRPYRMTSDRSDLRQLRKEYEALTAPKPDSTYKQMIPIGRAAFELNLSSAYITSMIALGKVHGSVKQKRVNMSSLEAHIATRRAA